VRMLHFLAVSDQSVLVQVAGVAAEVR